MWANAQRDGRPAKYRWCPLFNAAKFGLTPNTGVSCSNAAKTRNSYKFAGVPQTPEQIPAVSGPKFTILWRHVEQILLLTSFFSIVDMCLSCKDIARQSCAKVPRWRFFGSCISANRVQHIPDLRSKFALRPHHVPKYGKHAISDRWD